MYSNKKRKCYQCHLNATSRKSQKLIPSKKNQFFSNRKNWFPQNTKNRQSAKLNSRKNLVPHGKYDKSQRFLIS